MDLLSFYSWIGNFLFIPDIWQCLPILHEQFIFYRQIMINKNRVPGTTLVPGSLLVDLLYFVTEILNFTDINFATSFVSTVISSSS